MHQSEKRERGASPLPAWSTALDQFAHSSSSSLSSSFSSCSSSAASYSSEENDEECNHDSMRSAIKKEQSTDHEHVAVPHGADQHCAAQTFSMRVTRFAPDDSGNDGNVMALRGGTTSRKRRRRHDGSTTAATSLVGGPLVLRGAANGVGDVTPCQRRAAWRRVYAHRGATPLCFVCESNAVGLDNNAFHMAHVVPRACGGVNNQSFNRVPVCGTCNAKNGATQNLLDYVALNFPERVVPVVLYLKRIYDVERPGAAPPQIGLCAFVRRAYGDQAGYTRGGTVEVPLVYSALLEHERSARRLKRCLQRAAQMQAEIELLGNLLARFRRRLQRLQIQSRHLQQRVQRQQH